jgi:transposase
MHLPAYSPELNPVELLWREIMRKYFHIKIFNSPDDVENELMEALVYYHNNPDVVNKLANGYSYFNKINGG